MPKTRMNMAPDVRLPAPGAERQRPAEGQDKRAMIPVSIPEELPARLRQVYFLGSLRTGVSLRRGAPRSLNESEPLNLLGLGNPNGITGLAA